MYYYHARMYNTFEYIYKYLFCSFPLTNEKLYSSSAAMVIPVNPRFA